ncbi:BrnT family toxin [Candidatus Gottesmanbacteria bacterium]|nr:BrnT family toxin [Candidatus Gottesmanbacteria bacterium]
MKVIPEPVSFEWDEGNAEKSVLKHKVINSEAEQIFRSVPVIFFEDPKHSGQEKRYMIWGETETGRRLTVIFTIRKKCVRIISARDMHTKERRQYETEKTKNDSTVSD